MNNLFRVQYGLKHAFEHPVGPAAIDEAGDLGADIPTTDRFVRPIAHSHACFEAITKNFDIAK